MTDNTAVSNYKTVLFKLSGELLGGEDGSGIDDCKLKRVSDELVDLLSRGVRIAVVIGGGNFFRGGSRSQLSILAERGHQMGLLFTIANALVLEQGVIKSGADAVVQSAIPVPTVVEAFDWSTSKKHLDAGKVVIFAGGTGHPHFSTDTAASLRAIQVGADVLLKATKVDGVYDSDPKKNSSAVRYTFVTHSEALEKNLGFMDATSIALCREHSLPIRVFDASVKGGLIQAGMGEQIGSLVSKGEER